MLRRRDYKIVVIIICLIFKECMKKNILFFTVCLAVLSPVVVLATGLGNASVNLSSVTNDTGLSSDFSATLGMVIKATLSLVGTVFLVLMVYAGILWMTASGKEEQTEKARKIITASIIGLFITMSAYAITYFASNKLGASSTTDSTTSYCCCKSKVCGTEVQSACSAAGGAWIDKTQCK